MKKLIVTLALAAVGVSGAFAQGDFAFAGPGARGVWDDFSTPGTGHLAADIDVAFLFGSTANTPLVDAIAASTATNGTTQITSSAWTDILTDPNFELATNDNGGSPVLAVGTSPSNGAYSYTPPGGSAGGGFAVDGSASGGGSYRVFIIGWNSAYATPQAAALAGAAVGWSQYFTYAAVAGPNPGPAGSTSSMLSNAGNATVLQFGVEATPEPTTIALAGLGGLALLGLRRKK
jgi:hypothetical protein